MAVTLARRSEAVCLCVGWVCVGLALAVAPVSAQTPEPGGAAAQESEDLLGGFDDEQKDDPLSGFGDEFEPAFEVETDEPEEEPIWNLSGSAELSSSINYIPHRSSTGTDYTGMSRLRMRLNLELDVELPRDWEMRAAAYIFYDPIYAIRGRDRYTAEVLDLYEWEVDSLDVYVQGSLTQDLDMKLGRQVVIWGRSDTIRVLDVLNPLDQREPGRVDIEELRRPVTMARFNYYVDQWNLAAILIPEIRFGLTPAYGSDFFVDASRFLPPGAPPSLADAINTAPTARPDHFIDSEVALSATGTFSGWDISFHGAYLWDDDRYLTGSLIDPTSIMYEHTRIWMGGAGGNYILGSWLLKGEIAYFDGLTFSVADPASGQFVQIGQNGLDTMIGVEYYGFTDTSIALEVANRHLFGFDKRLAPGRRANRQETALRITRSFLNQTVDVTGVVLMFNNPAKDGALLRLSLDYEVFDGFLVGGGVLMFVGLSNPIDTWNDNDRIFLRAKYSF